MAGLPKRRRYTTVHPRDTSSGPIWPATVKYPGRGRIGSGRISPLLDHGKVYCFTGSNRMLYSVPPATITPLVASHHDCPLRIVSNARRRVRSGRSRECASRYRGPLGRSRGRPETSADIASHLAGRVRSRGSSRASPAGSPLSADGHRARFDRMLSHALSRISCDIVYRRQKMQGDHGIPGTRTC